MNKSRCLLDTHREASGYGIEADVDLVHKVGRLADTHEWTALVDVILPPVDLFVAFEREIYAPVGCLNDETV